MFKTNLAFSLLVVAFAKSGAQNSLLGSAQEHNLALTPCENDVECSHLQNATCKNKFCECLGTKFCADKIATVVNKIGEKCTDDGECNIGYSECQRGGCACSTGRVAPEDGRRCLTASKLNESCEDSVQCRSTDPRSECQNNECVCQQQMHEYDGVCYKNVGLGEHCNATGDCSLVQFSKCLVHCRCKNGYLRSDSGDKCLPVGKKISDPCSEDIQCSAELGAAICKDGHCGCMDSYQFQWKSNKCVRDKRFHVEFSH
ncbi:prion-like-(Q/N-rich) domain-bearing protein 25 isoform X2 [Cylas formicarius]|uniref:prion-like-(Q/N-rich) domain-bearing protein 25 isoform X2 n=1 Tax=Cylas formicarius TaxID=197179 RepID=UPI002958A8FA|nr:prion-like-(Q/N-rich) domain-bearing protein 25 isoform X2 [Cylas formicarius]